MATQTSALTVPHPQAEDQAVTAALYVTKHERNKSSSGNISLDGENKLPSTGATVSLKYVDPKDPPSILIGRRKDDSAAGTAACVGWANQKSFEHWKPEPSSSASKAAMLAKDYKAPPSWQPGQSTRGAKAAVLAAKDGGKVEIWKPEASAWGNSAANRAFKCERRGGLGPQIDYDYTTPSRQGSLVAATGAMSGSRKRSDSTPIPKPTYLDEANAITDALSAATQANNPSRKPRTEYSIVSGASPLVNMPKEMFTSHPPVAPEVDEKKRSDVLHASAVAMAKRMYNMQQRQIDQASKAQQSAGQNAATSAHGRSKSTPNMDGEAQRMQFISLQEAAQKLAQERLAKLHDEHVQNREYRNYYGDDSQSTPRLSIRSRVRRRASSDGKLDEDKEQSQRIRAQMSLFSSSLSQVDEKRRQKDREALMAVAQRNVAASLHIMDERVFKDTGKIAPSMLNEWEVKAHAAAQKQSDGRMENFGKVNIGGGKFIDRSAVEAVAARNVQPVLDEINAKAEKERVRQAELKLEQDARKRSAEAQKVREKEVKEINRKLKEQDKEEERLRREEERATKAEQKRVAKHGKRNNKKEVSTTQNAVSSGPKVAAGKAEAGSQKKTNEIPAAEEPAQTGSAPAKEGYTTPIDVSTSAEIQTNGRPNEVIKEGEKLPNPSDSNKGVKGWFKTKFTRRQSNTRKSDSKGAGDNRDFIGGAALETGNVDAKSPKHPGNDAALVATAIQDEHAGGTADETVGETSGEKRIGRSKRRASSVSPVSSLEDRVGLEKESSKDDDFEEARDQFDDPASPRTFTITKPASPARDSKFHEDIE